LASQCDFLPDSDEIGFDENGGEEESSIKIEKSSMAKTSKQKKGVKLKRMNFTEG